MVDVDGIEPPKSAGEGYLRGGCAGKARRGAWLEVRAWLVIGDTRVARSSSAAPEYAAAARPVRKYFPSLNAICLSTVVGCGAKSGMEHALPRERRPAISSGGSDPVSGEAG